MSESPATRPTLLLRTRDRNDRQAWDEFAKIYGPMLYAYARHRGLQDSDAADLAQEVMIIFASHAQQFDYDPERGSFRGWLFTVARNQIRKRIRQGVRTPQGTGESRTVALLAEQPAQSDEQADFDHHYHWRLFLWAAEQIKGDFRETTFRAFQANVIEEQAARVVAEQLGISVGAVYIAKTRVLTRIREWLQDADLS